MTGGSTSVLVDVTPGVNFIDAQITEGDIVTDGSARTRTSHPFRVAATRSR